MKKLCIAIALVMSVDCIVIFSSCKVRRSEPVKQQAFAPQDEEVKKGEEHFMHHCQKCHPGGESGLGPSINANPAPMFLKRFQVRHGLGVMPSFTEDEIKKEDLVAIAAYLRAWKRY